MKDEKTIRLRLRFYKDVKETVDVVRQKFLDYKAICPKEYWIKVIDNHIFLHIVGEKKHYYSPHLHLELEEHNESGTHIRGLFGPDQTLWTLFMFLHFVVAGIFTTFGIMAYTNYIIKKPLLMDGILMFLMVIVWFLLYVIAKQIRESGNDQMNELEELFEVIV
jgi:hypothetical protein